MYKMLSTYMYSIYSAHTLQYRVLEIPRGKIFIQEKRHIVRANEEARDYVEIARAIGVKAETARSIIQRAQLDRAW